MFRGVAKERGGTSGFAAETSSGSIFWVGASKRLSAVRWGVAQSMVMAWVLTLPAAGLVAALSYELLMLLGVGR